VSGQLQIAALTILGGVAVFVLGQIFLKFVIEPLQQYKEVKGEVSYALHYYANAGGPPGFAKEEERKEASEHLRGLASKLRVCRHKIPWYRLFAILGIVPKVEALLTASEHLTGWSNEVYGEGRTISKRRRIIAECLGIEDVH